MKKVKKSLVIEIKYKDLRIVPVNKHFFTVSGKHISIHGDNFLKLGGRYNTFLQKWLFDNVLKISVEKYIYTGKVIPFVYPSDKWISEEKMTEIYKEFSRIIVPEQKYTQDEIKQLLTKMFEFLPLIKPSSETTVDPPDIPVEKPTDILATESSTQISVAETSEISDILATESVPENEETTASIVTLEGDLTIN